VTDTVGWYEANARDFFQRTFEAGELPQLTDFTNRLPPGARVLEIGCGAGRDARILRERGFRVTATEASPALAALARAHSGVEVQVTTFEAMAWPEASFDGVWACASLLHAPRADLPGLLRRIAHALAPGGSLFMSFKHGAGEREANGRRFTDLDEPAAVALIGEAPGLELVSLAVNGDRRPGRRHESWLSVFCRKI
jgi:SAM-dependent methyltransferase